VLFWVSKTWFCIVQDMKGWRKQWLRGQYRLRLLVEHKAFAWSFLGLILLNTIALALVWDGQSKE
jgi:hypothetical protein